MFCDISLHTTPAVGHVPWCWGPGSARSHTPLRGSRQGQAIVAAKILSPNGKPQIREEFWPCSQELGEATSASGVFFQVSVPVWVQTWPPLSTTFWVPHFSLSLLPSLRPQLLMTSDLRFSGLFHPQPKQ